MDFGYLFFCDYKDSTGVNVSNIDSRVRDRFYQATQGLGFNVGLMPQEQNS